MNGLEMMGKFKKINKFQNAKLSSVYAVVISLKYIIKGIHGGGMVSVFFGVGWRCFCQKGQRGRVNSVFMHITIFPGKVSTVGSGVPPPCTYMKRFK